MFQQRVQQFVRIVDQFGGEVGVTIQGSQKTYKTWFGAIGTIIIYSIGLLYFVYLFQLYLTNGIPPSIAYLPSFIGEKRSHILTTPLMAFKIIPQVPDNDPNKVYFSPRIHNYEKVFQLMNSEYLQTSGCDSVATDTPLTDYFCVLQHYEMSLDFTKPGQEKYISIELFKCQKDQLLAGQYCASDDEILNSIPGTYIRALVFMQEYDYDFRRVKNVIKYQYSMLHQGVGTSLTFQLSDIEIDDGGLLRRYERMTTIAGFQSQSFTFDPSSLSATLGYSSDPVTRIQILLDPQIIKLYINYPKVGAIMAEFLSMFKIVLLFGLILKYLAERYGNERVCQLILQRHFPKATSSQTLSLLKNNDPNNPFRQDSLTQLRNLESILLQLVELKMITNLLLDSYNAQRLSDLGLNYRGFIEKLSEEGIELRDIRQKLDYQTKRNPLISPQSTQQEAKKIVQIHPNDAETPECVDKPIQLTCLAIGNHLNCLIIQQIKKNGTVEKTLTDDSSSFNQRFIGSLN